MKYEDPEYAEALEKFGRPMTYYPSIAKWLGLKETIFLCQLIYWTPKAHSGDGWIYKKVEEMQAETGLTYKEQIRLRESLVTQGLLEQRYSREEHVLHFKVNYTKFNSVAAQHMTKRQMPKHMTKSKMPASAQRGDGTLPKVSRHMTKSKIDKGSRDYTEITHKRNRVCESHPNAGRTPRGGCWDCYAEKHSA